MINQVQAKFVLDALIDLRDNGPTKPVTGICYNLEPELASFGVGSYEWVSENALGWSRHSGLLAYPVPSLGGRMWDKQHPQGQARYELLDYLIEKAKEQAE